MTSSTIGNTQYFGFLPNTVDNILDFFDQLPQFLRHVTKDQKLTPVAFLSSNSSNFSSVFWKLKVSKSQKQIMASWILPKNERWGNFQYIKLPQRSFFGRIQDNIFFFRDFLTFTNQDSLLLATLWYFFFDPNLHCTVGWNVFYTNISREVWNHFYKILVILTNHS